MISHSSFVPVRRIDFPILRSFSTAPVAARVFVASALTLSIAIVTLAAFVANLELKIVVLVLLTFPAAIAASFVISGRTREPTFKAVVITGKGPLSAILSASLHQSRSAGRMLGVRVVKDGLDIRRAMTIQEAFSRSKDDLAETVIVVEEPIAGERLQAVNGARKARLISANEVLERMTGRLALDLCTSEDVLDELNRKHIKHSGYKIAKRAIDLTAATGLGLIVFPLVGLMGLWSRIAHRTSAARGDECARSLLNLLKGDVSLVGPQPKPMLEAEARRTEFPFSKFRYAVTPGLTGWAQLKLASAERQLPRSLEYDLYYIKHASLGFDLRILAATALELTKRLGRREQQHIHVSVPELAPVVEVIHEPIHQPVISISEPRPADDLEPTLIVGAGDGGALLLNEMRRNRNWSFWPVAFADDDPHKIGTTIQSVPVVGKIAEIPDIVARMQIKFVVIAIPSASDAALSRIADIARHSQAQVFTMPNIGALLRGEETVRSLKDATIDDVLGRQEVSADLSRCRSFISGRRVLITGAAGSIGSEVARQVANLEPELILAVDVNESGMFDLCQELELSMPHVEIQPIPASVTNRVRLSQTFDRFQPDIVFHAAAYKHVPMMEEWPEEAVMVNAIGSARVAEVAAAHGVERFVLVSTDKAVRPTSVMGATKRLAELSVRAVGRETGLSTCCVRFGNVLGSRGSVIPIFERQINAGGPVKVTDPGMMRFFMTIPEAASLITEAGAMGHSDAIYMLEMGDEVSILELARRMIRLSGREEGRDIEIVFTGLRPGEKLREELAADTECSLPTDHRKIRLLRDTAVGRSNLDLLRDLQHIEQIACAGDHRQLRSLLFTIIDEIPPARTNSHPLNGHRPGESNGRHQMQPAC